MSLNFSLKLLNEKGMQKEILKAMRSHLRKNFKAEAKHFSNFVSAHILDAINESPTVKSLESGTLREELGLVNGAHAMQQIALGIINSNTLTMQSPIIRSNRISARIKLEAIPLNLSQFNDIANQVTEKGQQLPWFQWLTTGGDAIIVRDFKVSAGFPASSRTGDKIMVKGGGWRVPPEHAGSQTNNFITKAVDEVAPLIEKWAIYYFTEALGVR